MRRPEDRRSIAVETALLELFRLICVCIADVLVRIERDIFYTSVVWSFGVVPRLLLAAGLSGYRPRCRALEGRPERSGHTRENPVRSGDCPRTVVPAAARERRPRRSDQAVTLICRPE